MGVGKVLRSFVENIVVLLSKDLLKPVLLETLIAIPAGYIIMQKWTQGFACRITMDGWMFATAGVVAVLIALVTVRFQAVRAAMANPVMSLGSE